MRRRDFEIEFFKILKQLDLLINHAVNYDEEFTIEGYDIDDPDDFQAIRMYLMTMLKMSNQIEFLQQLQKPTRELGHLKYDKIGEEYTIDGFSVEVGDELEVLVEDMREFKDTWVSGTMEYDRYQEYSHGWYLSGEYQERLYTQGLDGLKARVRVK